jgi:tetratricopeptide (TPR) repeat protein
MSSPKSVFISYASEDTQIAHRLSDALRQRKLVVWLDKAELRGGVDWDNEIRRRIKDCGYVIPLISPNSEGRDEGYFRLEWRLAAERTHHMADDKPFLIPLVVHGVDTERARVPREFQRPQWTPIGGDDSLESFADHVFAVVTGSGTTFAEQRSENSESTGSRGTRDSALDLFQKGCAHAEKRTKVDLQTSIDLFNRSIQAESELEQTHAALAGAYLAIAANAYDSSLIAIPRARAAAQEALSLDPLMAAANATLGVCESVLNWNWKEAERRFRLALDVDPLSPSGHFHYATNYLVPVGDIDGAMSAFERACSLNPDSLVYRAHRAGVIAIAGDYGRAINEAYQTYRANPKFIGARGWLCYTYYLAGEYDKIVMLCSNAIKDPVSQQNLLWPLGCAYAKLGEPEKAKAIIAQYENLKSTSYVANNWVAAIWMSLGEHDVAFAEIAKSLDARDWYIRYLRVDPFWNELRSDVRFHEQVERLGLPA